MKSSQLFQSVLLVTGCVKPVEGQAYLVLKDADERLRQYREGLRYYLENTGFKRIVFCENSNCRFEFSDLECVANNQGKELEILSFCGNTEETRIRGKGFGEGEIVAYALEHSRYAESIRHFVKVTGRLIVRNLEDIRTRLDSSRFYINRLLIRNNPNVLDTRLYAIPAKMYKRCFQALHKNVTVEYTLEQSFMDCVRKNEIQYRCFPHYPLFQGMCGGDGMGYGTESPLFRFVMETASVTGCFNHKDFSNLLVYCREKRISLLKCRRIH